MGSNDHGLDLAVSPGRRIDALHEILVDGSSRMLSLLLETFAFSSSPSKVFEAFELDNSGSASSVHKGNVDKEGGSRHS